MNNLVNDINKVYDMLEDDLSRKIFNARLKYSLYKEYDDLGNCLTERTLDLHKMTNGLNIYTADFQTNETVIIYGAGLRGHWNIDRCKSINLKCNYIFCDSNYENFKNNKSSEYIVISPKELFSKYKDCKVIISIDDEVSFIKVFEFLKENGINQILSGDIYSPTQYFDPIVKFTTEEVFVDAGVLDGNTSLEFVEKCNNKYKKIYLFEANKSFKDDIESNTAHLNNVELHTNGLWNEKAVLSFSSNSGSSSISESGTIKIDVNTLDSMLQGQEATFIKMDIEGAELNALIGASETIKKYKPKLAICIYHKNEDILSIPLYIKQLVPEYKFYIRHYSNGNTETILYAVLD